MKAARRKGDRPQAYSARARVSGPSLSREIREEIRAESARTGEHQSELLELAWRCRGLGLGPDRLAYAKEVAAELSAAVGRPVTVGELAWLAIVYARTEGRAKILVLLRGDSK